MEDSSRAVAMTPLLHGGCRLSLGKRWLLVLDQGQGRARTLSDDWEERVWESPTLARCYGEGWLEAVTSRLVRIAGVAAVALLLWAGLGGRARCAGWRHHPNLPATAAHVMSL